jgi:hypothetical protein
MLPGDSNEASGDIDDVEGATDNMNGVSVEEISAPGGVPYGVSVKEIIAPEGAPPQYPPVPEGVMNEIDVSNGRPCRNVGTYRDGPANIRKFPIDGEEYDYTFSASILSEWDHPVPAVSNKGRIEKNYHPQKKISKEALAECYLMQTGWFEDPSTFLASSQTLLLDSWDSDNYYFNDISDPRLLAAGQVKKSKYNDDNPSFDMATRGPFQENFWQAMQIELNTLINEFDCWEYVPNPGKNVLPSTWAFKIKRYPDGRVKKFKAHFCARGDRQQEGIDYFETWAPVVQWSTVRIVMILALKLKLISVQCNITAAFIHGRVTEDIYVHQPRGFHRGKGDEVLKLKRTLYGLKQAPQYFLST